MNKFEQPWDAATVAVHARSVAFAEMERMRREHGRASAEFQAAHAEWVRHV